jgi:hypothetical protein
MVLFMTRTLTAKALAIFMQKWPSVPLQATFNNAKAGLIVAFISLSVCSLSIAPAQGQNYFSDPSQPIAANQGSQNASAFPISNGPSPFSASPFSYSGFNTPFNRYGLGLSSLTSIPGIPGIPRIGAGIPSIPYVGLPSIPYVGSLSSFTSLPWHGTGVRLGSGYGYGNWSPSYGSYSGLSNYASYSGLNSFARNGSTWGWGGWSRPMGRLSNQQFIQTAPSKAAGNYYAPATADPSAAGGYYAGSIYSTDNGNQSRSRTAPSNPGGTGLSALGTGNGSNKSVFGGDYVDFKSPSSSGKRDYTKPQKDYWGGSGSPFPQDLNSTPWSK